MRGDSQFEMIREDVEDKQKAILWEDGLRNGSSVDAFLWKGDPHAKPIQRAGLVIFGAQFFLLAVGIGAIVFEKELEAGSLAALLMALCSLLISLRLFRNAFLRASKKREREED